MRRWEHFYNSTCTNCSKLSLALVSMDLPNSISLDKGIQQGSPSVCIWTLYVTEEENPMWLKCNFVIIPAPLSVYLAEKKWIVLVLQMLLSSPHHLWTPRANSVPKHWYNETAAGRTLVLLSPNFWALSLMRISLLNCLYSRRKSISGQCTLNQVMRLACLRAADHATSQPLMLCTAYRQEPLDLAVHTWHLCNSKGRGYWEKRESAMCHSCSCFTTPAGMVRLICLVEDETCLRIEQQTGW